MAVGAKGFLERERQDEVHLVIAALPSGSVAYTYAIEAFRLENVPINAIQLPPAARSTPVDAPCERTGGDFYFSSLLFSHTHADCDLCGGV